MNEIIQSDIKEIIETNLDWGYFSGKSVLITGASGMLASYIVYTLLYLNEVLLDKPVKIICYVRDIKKAEEKFSESKNIEFYYQDLAEDIDKRVDPDVIIHAASHASPRFYSIDPVGTMMPNIIGTRNLLELSIERDVEKFLFFSSGEVYGQHNEGMRILKEDSYGSIDPSDVRSCYAVSKVAAETMCVSYAHQYNLEAMIVRPFHTYGPGMKLDDGRVFADFVRNIVEGENIVMKSDGKQKRPFCYIVDATKGFFYALLNGESKKTYNVANPYQSVSIKELAESLVGLYPEKKLKVTMQLQDNKNYLRSKINEQLPDISRLKELGWEPVIDIKEGFDRTVRSYT